MSDSKLWRLCTARTAVCSSHIAIYQHSSMRVTRSWRWPTLPTSFLLWSQGFWEKLLNGLALTYPSYVSKISHPKCHASSCFIQKWYNKYTKKYGDGSKQSHTLGGWTSRATSDFWGVWKNQGLRKPSHNMRMGQNVPFNRRLIIYPCCLVVFCTPPQPEKWWSEFVNDGMIIETQDFNGKMPNSWQPVTTNQRRSSGVFHMVKTISFVHHDAMSQCRAKLRTWPRKWSWDGAIYPVIDPGSHARFIG